MKIKREKKREGERKKAMRYKLLKLNKKCKHIRQATFMRSLRQRQTNSTDIKLEPKLLNDSNRGKGEEEKTRGKNDLLICDMIKLSKRSQWQTSQGKRAKQSSSCLDRHRRHSRQQDAEQQSPPTARVNLSPASEAPLSVSLSLSLSSLHCWTYECIVERSSISCVLCPVAQC